MFHRQLVVWERYRFGGSLTNILVEFAGPYQLPSQIRGQSTEKRRIESLACGPAKPALIFQRFKKQVLSAKEFVAGTKGLCGKGPHKAGRRK